MNLHEYFSDTRLNLTAAIIELFAQEKRTAAPMGGNSAKIMDALAQYACSGKMLRGILGRMGADLFTWNTTGPAKMSPELVKLGAALELFQAGLLVHDDIMDQDDLRRGKPTLHKRFESAEHELAADRACAFQPTPAIAPEHAPDYRRFGESKGICAGDIFFFEAWKLLAEADPRLAASLSPRFSRELVDVCLAQIADVGFGTLEAFPGMEEILEVYAYKTARYTITLPLCAGASLGGRPDAIPALEALGAPLGIVFQLQDDYLGLFGDERELGKPIGSDIREGKKTPYVILLLPRLSEADKRRFFGIFGRKDLDIRDLEYLRGLVLTYGVEEEIRRMIGSYVEKTRIALDFFSVQVDGFSAEAFSLLRDFIDYSISRKS